MLDSCDPMDCSLPGSSVHWISQARIMEWYVISFSRESYRPRDWTQVSCLAGRLFTNWATVGSPLSRPVNLENSAMGTGMEKVGFHSNHREKQWKKCSNYWTIALISHMSKVMLKILQARLQQYVNHELPDVQAWLRKGRGTGDQIANICWIIEKARTRVSEKHLLLLYWLL